MKSLVSRILATAALAAIGLVLAGAATQGPILEPSKLIIISTTDLKGKTSPCG